MLFESINREPFIEPFRLRLLIHPYGLCMSSRLNRPSINTTKLKLWKATRERKWWESYLPVRRVNSKGAQALGRLSCIYFGKRGSRGFLNISETTSIILQNGWRSVKVSSFSTTGVRVRQYGQIKLDWEEGRLVSGTPRDALIRHVDPEAMGDDHKTRSKSSFAWHRGFGESVTG